MTIRKVVRERAPLLISIAGVSGSGKTFSALRMAAGMAQGGKVGFLDTENKRGGMYADSKTIMKDMPQGYMIDDLTAPFAPKKYTDSIAAFEAEGCKVLVIDSMSHEWDGIGGCQDIAENNKLGGSPNWAMAKREHKRMMNTLLASKMDIIFCLRAQEKVKLEKDSRGKLEFVPIGMQALQEKNFIFEMTLSMLLDEKTHLPNITKCPEPLLHLFTGEPQLITPEVGQRLIEWATGAVVVPVTEEKLFNDAIAEANSGMAALLEHWNALPKAHQAMLKPRLDEAKAVATMADERNAPKTGFIDEILGDAEIKDLRV